MGATECHHHLVVLGWVGEDGRNCGNNPLSLLLTRTHIRHTHMHSSTHSEHMLHAYIHNRREGMGKENYKHIKRFYFFKRKERKKERTKTGKRGTKTEGKNRYSLQRPQHISTNNQIDHDSTPTPTPPKAS